jgi:hypothetical protein
MMVVWQIVSTQGPFLKKQKLLTGKIPTTNGMGFHTAMDGIARICTLAVPLNCSYFAWFHRSIMFQSRRALGTF